ncbi:MAG: hypothetical protein AAF394_05565 [Planctomycetota bacterium]
MSQEKNKPEDTATTAVTNAVQPPASPSFQQASTAADKVKQSKALAEDQKKNAKRTEAIMAQLTAEECIQRVTGCSVPEAKQRAAAVEDSNAVVTAYKEWTARQKALTAAQKSEKQDAKQLASARKQLADAQLALRKAMDPKAAAVAT